MEVGQGRMLIEILPVQNEMNGMTIPVGERNQWGIVVKVGEPSIHQYSEKQMRQWESIGKHPCSIQPGDKVLLAGVRGIQVVIDGKTYHIVLQDEVPAWEPVKPPVMADPLRREEKRIFGYREKPENNPF